MKESLIKKLRYFLFSSFRRKRLDILSEKYKKYYKGIVLDIGGRDRGAFKKPKEKVDQWIFADIEKSHNPDMVLDVSDMKAIESCSIDTIGALELFEHVENLEKGLDECKRVLKPDGVMIMSVPFMFPVHGDPFDFQRWTLSKWVKELRDKRRFSIEEQEFVGRFFIISSDAVRNFIFALPRLLRYFGYLILPIIHLSTYLDELDFVKKNKKLSGYHGGYFFVIKKDDK